MPRSPSSSRIGTKAAAIVLAAAFVWSRAWTADAAIPWETKIERARAAAVRANQPMLIEFWATWCTVCEAMDREVYADERVAAAMHGVVPVRLDVDRAPDLARQYDVGGTPTLVLTDSFGNELFRFTGALSRERLLQLLAELPRDVSRINALSARLAADKNDFAALDGLGRELRAGGFYRASSDYYDRALRTRDGRPPTDARAAILQAMGQNALALHAFDEASRLFAQALKEFSGRASEPQLLLGLGQAQIGLRKTADARKTLESLIARHRDTRAAAAATRLLANLPSS